MGDYLPSLVSDSNINAMIDLVRRTGPAIGSFVEVGVYKGGTAQHIARLAAEMKRQAWFFDTFEGIPYADPSKGDRHVVGDFGSGVDFFYISQALQRIHHHSFTIKGLFPHSAHGLVPLIGPIAFVHLDVDQYRSYIEAIDFLSPLMAKGGLMFFDDVGILGGADRAVQEKFPHPRVICDVGDLKPHVRF
jgi:hypothetical protein